MVNFCIVICSIVVIVLWNKLWSKLFNGQFIAAFYRQELGYRTINVEVKVQVLFQEKDIFPTTYSPISSSLPEAHNILLSPDGMLEEGMIFVDEDPRKAVISLQLGQSDNQLVFTKNTVYESDGIQLGRQLYQFEQPEMESIHYVNYINDEIILMIANPNTQPHVQTKLWQVNLKSFEKKRLNENPYYGFEQPPLVLTPVGFDGIIAVYYSDKQRFGFVNHSSRPKFSTIRIYSSKYPEGEDLIEFKHDAGTVINVDAEEGALIVTTDPNRPFQYDKALNTWRVSLGSHMGIDS